MGAEYRDKLKSLSFVGAARPSKKTVDVHDSHTVEVTEHWDDRVDVAVKPETIHVETDHNDAD